MTSIAWEAPPLSSCSVAATAYYRDGVAALVAGIAHADELFATALALDPGFVLAKVGRAVVRAAEGSAYSSPTLLSDGLQRGERQHAEIVRTALLGDPRHAIDLRREHLLEYPGDLLIVWLPVLVGPAQM